MRGAYIMLSELLYLCVKERDLLVHFKVIMSLKFQRTEEIFQDRPKHHGG